LSAHLMRASFWPAITLLIALTFAVTPLLAQPLPINNASFEQGREGPDQWTLSPGADGIWLQDNASAGRRAIALRGDGRSTSYWRSSPVAFAPSQLYVLRFSARSIDSKEGAPMSGPLFCNRDIGDLAANWTPFSSIFFTPMHIKDENSWLRFGQWRVKGALAFDDIRIVPIQPVYARQDKVELGEGESISGNTYLFNAPFSSTSRNHSRPLLAHQCNFNTNRWVFARDSQVVYRHALADRQQLSAKIKVGIGYYESGALAVEASANGRDYIELGQISAAQTQTFSLPDTLLPAAVISVRLRSVGKRQLGPAADPGALQVHSYSYEAIIEGEALDMRGRTRFVAIEEAADASAIVFHSLGDGIPGGDNHLELSIDTKASPPATIAPELRVITRHSAARSTPSPHALHSGLNALKIPYTIEETGPHSLALSWPEPTPFKATIDLDISPLYAASYGRILPGSNTDVALWSADSAWKISRQRPIPTEAAPALYISAASAESEAVQLVLTPQQALKKFRAHASDLHSDAGAAISASQIDLMRVDYVSITHPTDEIGVADQWPDPLPMLPASSDIAAGGNQPLWIRVAIPGGTPAGIYRGSIELNAENYHASVPLVVEVYGFTLPSRMSCSTALGFSFDEVVRYHNLQTESEKRQVLDLYFKSFASHHISPYEPAPLDPLRVSWDGLEPHFLWQPWDRAVEEALANYGFNSFRLRLLGLGGGSFESRREPQLNGLDENDPQYEIALSNYLSAIEKHLEAKGWLDEAFVYWFDEPRQEDYEFVNNGFAKLKRHAPKLRRMLTEQVEQELLGGPTIWCPVTPNFSRTDAAARKSANESFWWYVCTIPKAPYAGLFIDHAGIELRTWLWQTWQNGIDGILIWQSNYWHSEAAYVDSRQNPYADPMSWMSSVSAPVGSKRPWGNGDGRLIYPPLTSVAAQRTRPIIAGPVASQRWEMLRDGIEDYEYFAILRRLLEQRDELPATDRARYEHLLSVPMEISQSASHFSIAPAPLLAHRHALARAIEELSAPPKL
jgi:hypothetical protein